MAYLNSDTFLDLLTRDELLTPRQRQFIEQNKSKIVQKLVRQFGGRRQDDDNRQHKNFPDYIDIILALGMETGKDKRVPLTEDIMLQAVSRELRIPFKKLDPLKLNMEVITKYIPKHFAIRHLLLPFAMKDGVLHVVTYFPDNQHAIEDVERANQCQVVPYLSSKEDIKKILGEFFGFQRSISAAESQFGATSSSPIDIGNLEQYVRLSTAQELSSTDQHIKAAVDHLFSAALDQRASDIHIEPKRDACIVRFRIDGILHTVHTLPKAVHSAITSRIKTLARLDIAEKRRPQDGRIKLGRAEDGGGAEAEIRVSTVPVAFGEKTVMRILNPEVIFQDLDDLGFSQRDRVVYNSFLASSHGLIFVTGPTGSGESTTLYSTL